MAGKCYLLPKSQKSKRMNVLKNKERRPGEKARSEAGNRSSRGYAAAKPAAVKQVPRPQERAAKPAPAAAP
ncbi:hypothetical protein MOV65_02375, partial [Neorhizobium sp. SHOUNA12B]|nr:hypothetical protein [Neorhizobium sp. SHOUNA12B]